MSCIPSESDVHVTSSYPLKTLQTPALEIIKNVETAPPPPPPPSEHWKMFIPEDQVILPSLDCIKTDSTSHQCLDHQVRRRSFHSQHRRTHHTHSTVDSEGLSDAFAGCHFAVILLVWLLLSILHSFSFAVAVLGYDIFSLFLVGVASHTTNHSSRSHTTNHRVTFIYNNSIVAMCPQATRIAVWSGL